MTDTVTGLSTVLSTRRTPQLGEVAILRQRKLAILDMIDLYGKAITETAFRELCNELADIETSLQRYGGTMEAEKAAASRVVYDFDRPSGATR